MEPQPHPTWIALMVQGPGNDLLSKGIDHVTFSEFPVYFLFVVACLVVPVPNSFDGSWLVACLLGYDPFHMLKEVSEECFLFGGVHDPTIKKEQIL